MPNPARNNRTNSSVYETVCKKETTECARNYRIQFSRGTLAHRQKWTILPECAKNNRTNNSALKLSQAKKITLVKCARNKRTNNNKFVCTVQCELKRLNFV